MPSPLGSIAQGFAQGAILGNQMKTARLNNRLLQSKMDREESSAKMRRLIMSGGRIDEDVTSGTSGPNMNLMGEYAAMDPEGANALMGVIDKMDARTLAETRRKAALGGRIALQLQDLPEQQRPLVYPQLIEHARSQGLDVSRLPRQYDPQAMQMALAQSLGVDKYAEHVQKRRLTKSDVMTVMTPKGPKTVTVDEAARTGATPESKVGTDTPYSEDVEAQKIRLAQAGRPQTISSIPKDHRAVYDSVGNITGFEVIPGSPTSRKIAKETKKAAKEVSAEKKRVGAETTTAAEKADAALSAITGIKKEMKDAALPPTGTLSIPSALYSGSAAGRIRSYVATLKSNVALGAMIRLKEASKTGATGFGQMNQNELQLLIDDLGVLDPDSTDPEIFAETIERIENRYERVIADIKKNVSPERIRELGLEGIMQSATSSGRLSPSERQELDALRKKYGR